MEDIKSQSTKVLSSAKELKFQLLRQNLWYEILRYRLKTKDLQDLCKKFGFVFKSPRKLSTCECDHLEEGENSDHCKFHCLEESAL